MRSADRNFYERFFKKENLAEVVSLTHLPACHVIQSIKLTEEQAGQRALFLMTPESHHTSYQLLSQGFTLQVSSHTIVLSGHGKYHNA